MSTLLKKIASRLFFAFALVFLPAVAFASEIAEFKPIVPIKGITDNPDITFAEYANQLFTISISLGAILAVLMIVWGGFEYMTSAAGVSKKDGAERIRGAVIGLILLLASFLILNVINPCLVSISVFDATTPTGPHSGCSPRAPSNSATTPEVSPTDPFVDGQTDAQGRRHFQTRVGMCQGQPGVPIQCSGATTVCTDASQNSWEKSGACLTGEQETTVCPYGCDETRPIISLNPSPENYEIGGASTVPGACEAANNGAVKTFCCKQNRTNCYEQTGAPAGTQCDTPREYVNVCVRTPTN